MRLGDDNDANEKKFKPLACHLSCCHVVIDLFDHCRCYDYHH